MFLRRKKRVYVTIKLPLQSFHALILNWLIREELRVWHWKEIVKRLALTKRIYFFKGLWINIILPWYCTFAFSYWSDVVPNRSHYKAIRLVWQVSFSLQVICQRCVCSLNTSAFGYEGLKWSSDFCIWVLTSRIKMYVWEKIGRV